MDCEKEELMAVVAEVAQAIYVVKEVAALPSELEPTVVNLVQSGGPHDLYWR